MKYQLHCPKCHYEWSYDAGRIDSDIHRLGVEIFDIIQQLAEHNNLPRQEQIARTYWWKSAKKALAGKQKKLAELKSLRKMANQEIKRTIDDFFRQIVKEKIGDEEYIKLCEKADAEAEAYNISSVMRHTYTRSGGKDNVTNIGKI